MVEIFYKPETHGCRIVNKTVMALRRAYVTVVYVHGPKGDLRSLCTDAHRVYVVNRAATRTDKATEKWTR